MLVSTVSTTLTQAKVLTFYGKIPSGVDKMYAEVQYHATNKIPLLCAGIPTVKHAFDDRSLRLYEEYFKFDIKMNGNSYQFKIDLDYSPLIMSGCGWEFDRYIKIVLVKNGYVGGIPIHGRMTVDPQASVYGNKGVRCTPHEMGDFSVLFCDRKEVLQDKFFQYYDQFALDYANASEKPIRIDFE